MLLADRFGGCYGKSLERVPLPETLEKLGLDH